MINISLKSNVEQSKNLAYFIDNVVRAHNDRNCVLFIRMTNQKTFVIILQKFLFCHSLRNILHLVSLVVNLFKKMTVLVI